MQVSQLKGLTGDPLPHPADSPATQLTLALKWDQESYV